MIVNRRTFIARQGQLNAAAELLSTGSPHMSEIPTYRIYTSVLGAGGRVVLEIEFENLAHYERWWAEWGAKPESAQLLERWSALVREDWTNEIWQLR